MLSLLRRCAQSVRHNQALSFLDPAWPILRKPYLTVMTTFGRRHGIAIEIAGCTMRLHPAFCTQNWETVEAESYSAFAAAVRPGAVVFDIGAHIGTYSIIAFKKSGNQGRVVAYEPHDYTRGHLIQHLAWNGVRSEVVVRDVCCGAKVGTADFFCKPGEAEGMNGLVPVSGFVRRTVSITTLDSEVCSLSLAPDIFKIDVEGAEWDVLKGAEQALRQYHPVLFLSLHPTALAKRDESPEIILDWLQQRGYEHEVIARDHEIHVIARCRSEA